MGIARFVVAGFAVTAFTAAVHSASATLITDASLYSPMLSGFSATTVNLGNAPGPSQASIFGAGYSVAFNTAAGQGLVQGASQDSYAIPVAGVSNGQATYLSGGLGSTTANAALSGSYLSTGGIGGSIVVSFITPQTTLALLWGSIDAGNRLALNNAAGDVVTGAEIQALAVGFIGNGYQGVGGSAYVLVTSDTPFTSITLSSSEISFEAAGLVAGAPLNEMAIAIPEPASLALFGSGLAVLARIGRRKT
jgi:hypothetical protein